jgi:hypothetical protein
VNWQLINVPIYQTTRISFPIEVLSVFVLISSRRYMGPTQILYRLLLKPRICTSLPAHALYAVSWYILWYRGNLTFVQTATLAQNQASELIFGATHIFVSVLKDFHIEQQDTRYIILNTVMSCYCYCVQEVTGCGLVYWGSVRGRGHGMFFWGPLNLMCTAGCLSVV